MQGHDPASATARARRRRRRFALLAASAIAVVAAALGVSFTADTAVNTPTVTALTKSKLVFVQASDIPSTQGFTFRVASQLTPLDPTTPSAPVMTPVAGAAGTVTQKGDIALIDARTSSARATTERVTIYLANLKALQSAYTQFAFPIRLYNGYFNDEGTPTIGGDDSMSWTAGPSDLLSQSQNLYLTNTGGYLSFTLQTQPDNSPGDVVAVQLGEDGSVSPATTTGDGGSFYTVDTSTPGSLSPTFYISVTTS